MPKPRSIHSGVIKPIIAAIKERKFITLIWLKPNKSMETYRRNEYSKSENDASKKNIRNILRVLETSLKTEKSSIVISDNPTASTPLPLKSPNTAGDDSCITIKTLATSMESERMVLYCLFSDMALKATATFITMLNADDAAPG